MKGKIILHLFCVLGLYMGSMALANNYIKENRLAGYWYPSDAHNLRSMLTKYLEGVKEVPKDPLALILPHAGYVYSGSVAAYGYKGLEGGQVKKVVIVGPSHYLPFRGFSVEQHAYYTTPFGPMPIDRSLGTKLSKSSALATYIPQAHEKEHSVEIQIPLLQMVTKDCSIVPIVMGDQSLATAKELSRALLELAKEERFLLIASSDLSHYHSEEKARQMDHTLIQLITLMDENELEKAIDAKKVEACGIGPIYTSIIFSKAKSVKSGRLLRYGTSAEVTKDKTRVVGYASVGFFK